MECFITDILTCDLGHDKCSFIAKFLLNEGLDNINLTLLPGPQTPQNDIAICSWENQVTNTDSERGVRFWALICC